MEIVLDNPPGLAVAAKKIGRKQIDPWRLTVMGELITWTHRRVLPFSVKGSHGGVQNTAYNELLARKSDSVKRSSRTVQKCHRLLKLSAAFEHRPKPVHNQYIFCMKHGERMWVVAGPCVIIGLKEEGRIGCGGLSDQSGCYCGSS